VPSTQSTAPTVARGGSDCASATCKHEGQSATPEDFKRVLALGALHQRFDAEYALTDELVHCGYHLVLHAHLQPNTNVSLTLHLQLQHNTD
jgi:hypothetical protein